jgi:rhodanese-related sulfurtransferase
MFAQLMGLKTISPQNLLALVQAGQVATYDVNSRQSWARGHVPGAVNIDPAGYGENDLPPDRGATLVFYCSNVLCRKAPNAALRAQRMGYTNVQVMSAGISGWISAGLPTEAQA